MRRNVPQLIVVRGRGQFPWDMLRRDECTPFDLDSERLRAALEPNRDHHVIRLYCWRSDGPNVARWESFGWACCTEAGWLNDHQPHSRRWRVGEVRRPDAGGVLYNAVTDVDGAEVECNVWEPTHDRHQAELRVARLNSGPDLA